MRIESKLKGEIGSLEIALKAFQKQPREAWPRDGTVRVVPRACEFCGAGLMPSQMFMAEDIDSGEVWVVCRACGEEGDAEARDVLRGRELGRDHVELLRGPPAPSSPAPETE